MTLPLTKLGKKFHDYLEEAGEMEDVGHLGLRTLPKNEIAIFPQEISEKQATELYVRIDLGSLEEILTGALTSPAVAVHYLREMKNRLGKYAAPYDKRTKESDGIFLWTSTGFDQEYPQGILGKSGGFPVLPLNNQATFDDEHGIFATAYLNLQISNDQWPQFCDEFVQAHEESVTAVLVQRHDKIEQRVERRKPFLQQTLGAHLGDHIPADKLDDVAGKLADAAAKHEITARTRKSGGQDR